jgi:hypothetical protein
MIFRKEWNFRSPGGTAVALMSSGIKTATGLLCAGRWTTGKRTISDIILGMSIRRTIPQKRMDRRSGQTDHRTGERKSLS